MNLETEVRALQRVPMFRDLDKGRLKLLAFTSERVGFSAGQVLFNRGDTSDAAYVILEGKAHALVDAPTGVLKVAEFGAHDLIGEMGVLAETPRSASVVAITDLLVLRIDKDVFLELLHQFPQIAIAVMRELAHRLERTTSRLARTGSPAG
ncbi:MAG: Crp/Fnr family transcriptional regulator [Pseudochelatococcus sp.]|jgi:CRP/FNR family cyclic AMP-dependent transcriptional regulator|uniref:Crp/Fnr family transcriptional regulator n=1 Tax=Pseudochelatococcus sp. TaxID=2020869 RepID=UPI003D8B3786